MPRPGPRKFEKSKNFKGSIKRLLSTLKPWRVLLVTSLTLAMISAILSLVAPNQLSGLTDTITEGLTPNLTEEKITEIMTDPNISMEDKGKLQLVLENAKKADNEEILIQLDTLPGAVYEKIKPSMDLDKIKKIALLLTTLYLISALFQYIESILMTHVSNNLARSLRSRISNKINTLPLSYFDQNETGDILSRVTNDVDTIAQSLDQSLSTLVTSSTLFIGSIIMMFVTNWIMAITAILSSLLGFGLMALILGKSQKYFIQRQQELGNLNGHIEEIYSGHNVVKAYNGEKKASEDFDKLNERLYNCNRKSQFLSGMM